MFLGKKQNGAPKPDSNNPAIESADSTEHKKEVTAEAATRRSEACPRLLVVRVAAGKRRLRPGGRVVFSVFAFVGYQLPAGDTGDETPPTGGVCTIFQSVRRWGAVDDHDRITTGVS